MLNAEVANLLDEDTNNPVDSPHKWIVEPARPAALSENRLQPLPRRCEGFFFGDNLSLTFVKFTVSPHNLGPSSLTDLEIFLEVQAFEQLLAKEGSAFPRQRQCVHNQLVRRCIHHK